MNANGQRSPPASPTNVIKPKTGVPNERLEGGRDILLSSDVESSDLKGAGRCLNVAYFQHGGETTEIGQDRQWAKTGDSLA